MSASVDPGYFTTRWFQCRSIFPQPLAISGGESSRNGSESFVGFLNSVSFQTDGLHYEIVDCAGDPESEQDAQVRHFLNVSI